jgi:Fe2+ transport system protein FeoA
MKLTDTKINEKVKITSVDSGSYQHRLLSMGMIEGCSVCPLQKNGTTILVDVNGCHYAMSKEITDCIHVSTPL